MSQVRYDDKRKHNGSFSKVTRAPCAFCLEQSTFRVIKAEQINKATGNVELANRVACTRCLNSVRYNKRLKPIQHNVVKFTHFTAEEYIRRTYLRVKRWFTGDHVYGPFGRKRTK